MHFFSTIFPTPFHPQGDAWYSLLCSLVPFAFSSRCKHPKKKCWEASADGCITQVSFMRLLPYPLASVTRSRQSQLIRFYPSNLPCRQTAAAVSDGRRKRKEVSWYEWYCDSCTCHKRNEVLTSSKRFATLFLFSTIKRFHSCRVETVFLCLHE